MQVLNDAGLVFESTGGRPGVREEYCHAIDRAQWSQS